MRTRPSDYLYRFLLVACVSIVAAGVLGCFTLGTPTPVVPLIATETPTPVIIVVTATPVVPPSPTATALATATATVTPSATPTKPAATATATATPVPAKPTVPAGPSPTPICQELPVRGFGKVWIENESARNYVGCSSYPKSEMGVDFTAQRFEQGVVFFTNASGYFDKDSVLVLFRDDKTWSKVVVPADAAPSPIGAPPAGKYAPSGRIGWVWQQAAGVKARLGWGIEPEKSGTVAAGTNAAWQAFSRGYLYWIKYNDPDDRWIYVVATTKPYPPGGNRADWLEFKDTWNP
jgi:hypothetical protein